MCYLYILKSLKLNKLYIGVTSNLVRRIEFHNNGLQKWSKRGIPWKLLFNIELENKTIALRLERKLKNFKNPSYILELIKNGRIAQLASPDR